MHCLQIKTSIDLNLEVTKEMDIVYKLRPVLEPWLKRSSFEGDRGTMTELGTRNTCNILEKQRNKPIYFTDTRINLPN